MEATDNEEIRKRIEKESAKTELVVEEYKEMTKPVAPENAIGRLSRMYAINNKAVTEAALRQAEDKLDKLRYVLTKVGDPEFGLCRKCKAPIPLGRILLMPQSLYCVSVPIEATPLTFVGSYLIGRIFHDVHVYDLLCVFQ